MREKYLYGWETGKIGVKRPFLGGPSGGSRGVKKGGIFGGPKRGSKKGPFLGVKKGVIFGGVFGGLKSGYFLRFR